ncbi:MAG TPA: polysaccharide biosynthesis C-terminal domain-containing protein, partial [Alphaproteobacteria bacterium]|nr:polysaccharide biosynthesis C-terminal domain-containing protein [Alphaproteobacteria bacterium]
GYNRNAILPTIAYLTSLIIVLLLFTKPILKFLSCYSSPSKGDIKKKHQKHRLTYFDKKLFSKITRFAIPSTISNISGTVIGYIDTIVLIFLAPLATVGIYNATISTILIVSYLGGVISIVLFPLISELHTRKDKKSLETVVNITYRYSLMVVLPLAIAMLFFSRLILKLLFGAAFEMGATAMSVLAIGTIFLTIFQVNSSVINGIGKPKILTYITITAAAFNLAGNIILIPYLGINGAALATTTSYFIMMLWSQIYLYNKVNIRFHKILQTFISAAIFFAALYFVKILINTNILLEIIATCIIAGIFYAISLLVLKAITIEEIRSLFGKITKK